MRVLFIILGSVRSLVNTLFIVCNHRRFGELKRGHHEHRQILWSEIDLKTGFLDTDYLEFIRNRLNVWAIFLQKCLPFKGNLLETFIRCCIVQHNAWNIKYKFSNRIPLLHKEKTDGRPYPVTYLKYCLKTFYQSTKIRQIYTNQRQFT